MSRLFFVQYNIHLGDAPSQNRPSWKNNGASAGAVGFSREGPAAALHLSAERPREAGQLASDQYRQIKPVC